MVDYRLVAGAGASLWAGLPWCLLDVSRGGPWLAACGGFVRCTASMGAPLCVGGTQWGQRWGVGAGLVSVSSAWFAAVRRVFSSAGPLGGPLWRCVGSGFGLGGSWEGAGHAGLGWLGGGGGSRMCGPALRPSLFWAVVSPACLPSTPSALPSSACPLPPSFYVLVLLPFFFLWAGLVVGVRRLRCWAWSLPVLVLVWAWVLWRMVDGLLRSGFPVCVSVLGHPVASGFQSVGQVGAGGGRCAAVVVWCLCGWSRLSASAWVAWPDASARVAVFVVRAVWVAGIPLLGAGRLLLGVGAWPMLWYPAWVVVRALFVWV